PPPSRHRPDLTPALEAICLKAMARRVTDRFDSMRAFADALQQYLKESSGPSSKVVPEQRPATRLSGRSPRPVRPKPSAPRHRWRKIAVVAGVAAALALLLLSVILLVQTPEGTIRIELVGDATNA